MFIPLLSSLATNAAEPLPEATPRATVRPAPMRRYPGAAPQLEVALDPDWVEVIPAIGVDGKLPADCNSPAYWSGGLYHLFNSWDHPWITVGVSLEDVLHKDEDGDGVYEDTVATSVETIVDSNDDAYEGVYGSAAAGDAEHPEPGGGKGGLYDFNGGRHLEGVWFHEDSGRLYGWYHNETDFHDDQLDFGNRYPCVALIGQMYSDDGGFTWVDQGIVLTPELGSLVPDAKPGTAQDGWPPPNSDYADTWQHYYAGGVGDFGTIAAVDGEYLYVYAVAFHTDDAKDGFVVFRINLTNGDLDDPVGKFQGWKDGGWTGAYDKAPDPISVFDQPNGAPGAADGHGWMDKYNRGYWNPAIHWNTALQKYVMVVHRLQANGLEPGDGSRDTGSWVAEGLYVSYNDDLSNPEGWSQPTKLMDRLDMVTEDPNAWYVSVHATGADESSERMGAEGRLFVQGRSKWTIHFDVEVTPDLQINFEGLGLANDDDIPGDVYHLPGELEVEFRGVDAAGNELDDAFFPGTSALNFLGDYNGDADPALEGYAGLANVVYAALTDPGTFGEVALVPQPGFEVTLHSFDLSGFDASDALDLSDHRQDVEVRVLRDGGPDLFATEHMDIDGDPWNAARRVYVDATSSAPIRIRFEALGGMIGLDNVQLSVNPCDDEDGDGVCADLDLCPLDADPTNADVDGDGVGDVCDVPPTLLDADPGSAGANNLFTVIDGPPNADVTFYFGGGNGTSAIATCPGLSLGIPSPKVLGKAKTDGTGTATVGKLIPAGTAGKTMKVQALFPAFCVLSDVDATNL